MIGRWLARWRDRRRPYLWQTDPWNQSLPSRDSIPAEPEAEPPWVAEMKMRGTRPVLYADADADTYWGQRYRDFFSWVARETAAAATLRRECGLAPA